MQESAAWQHGVPQAALDSIVYLGNEYNPPTHLTAERDDGKTSEDGAVSEEEDDPMAEYEEPPLSPDFLNGVRRWPSRDHAGTSPAASVDRYSWLVKLILLIGH